MVYKWYILPIGGLYNTYHLLGEPETAIDITLCKFLFTPWSTYRKGVLLIIFFPTSEWGAHFAKESTILTRDQQLQ